MYVSCKSHMVPVVFLIVLQCWDSDTVLIDKRA